MQDWDGEAGGLAEWRDRNRGLTVALSACLALWIIAITALVHHH
jgi:hypothetical protein